MKIKNFLKSSLASTALVSTIITGATVASFTSVAVAQDYTSGEIRGTVYNSDGSKATSGVVTLTSESRGFSRTYSISNDGTFSFARLPVGNYNVTATSQGNSSTTESIKVLVGKTVDAYLIVSSGADVDEIIVQGERINSSKYEVATTGLTIDVSDTFKKIPLGRDLTSVSLLAPKTEVGDGAFTGAGRNSLTSISGSSVAENAYYINGMNITEFRNFIGAASVPFEFYDQISTKTGGFSAEFGRATGGVVNAVTKSGSNEWHFGANFYMSPNALRGPRNDTYLQLNSEEEYNAWEANLWASGPILEDRAFFYLLYSPRFKEYDNYAKSGIYTVSSTENPFFGGKIDLNITDNHNLELTYFSDKQEFEDTDYDVTYLNDDNELDKVDYTSGRLGLDQKGGNVGIVKYTGKFLDNLTVSALYGQQEADNTVKSINDSFPVVAENLTGRTVSLGDWVNFLVESGDDKRELMRFDVDYSLDNFFGDHSFRLGFDQEDLSSNALVSNSGGAYYLYYGADSCDSFRTAKGLEATGELCVRVRDYRVGGSFETTQTAFYLQDSWDVNDRLTLNLGVRSDSFDNRNGSSQTFVNLENQLAPRISGAYDLAEDGSLSVYASFGKYYLPIPNNTNIRLAGNETYIHSYYDITGRNADLTPIYASTNPFRVDVTADGSTPDTRSVTDVNLDPMFANELILGIKKSFTNGLLDGWNLDANYTYRDLGAAIEDVAIDAGVLKYCERENLSGCADVWKGFHQYVLTNPGEDMRVWMSDDDAVELTDADGNALTAGRYMDLTAEELNYPAVSRLYEALSFTLSKNTDVWSVLTSYTYGKSYGNYEGSVKSDNGQDDAGITTDFDQPGLVDGAKGYLPNHRAHQFKFFGSYAVTEQFNVGMNARVSSPRKFGCIGVHPFDEFAAVYGVGSWYCGSKLTPRGESFEGEWYHQVDISASYSRPLLNGNLTFKADIFNILGTQIATDFEEDGEITLNVPSRFYGNPIRFQSPRSVRLGVSWEY